MSMKEFLQENWQLLLTTAAILIQVVGGVFLVLIRKRLKQLVSTPKELQVRCEKAEAQYDSCFHLGEIMMCIPTWIKEAEQVFTTEKSGSLKFGYVIGQIQKKLSEYKMDGVKASDLSVFIEDILSTPEKKGEK